MNLPIYYDVDITQPLLPVPLQSMLVSKDALANRIGVRLYQGKTPYSPGGQCAGYVVRRDGYTVPITGVINGNEMYIDLPPAAYALEGPINIGIKNVQGDAIATVFLGMGTVSLGETDIVIDPGSTITLSVAALIADIEAARESLPSDYTALLAIVSPNYSTSATYDQGDYVWYSGVLYRAKQDISVPEAWTAAHWQAAVIGNDLSAARRDVNEISKNDTFVMRLNPGSGYMPFYAASGDSITVKTASGDDFAGTTAIAFYDDSKSVITSYNVSSAYNSARTFAVELSAPARYVRLLVNGWAGEDLIIVNNDNTQYGQIKADIQKVDNKLEALYKTTDQSANFTALAYIALNGGIGSTVSITPVESIQRGYVILPCKAGDTFTLTATGGSAPRAWGFTDTAYKLLSVAASGANPSNLALKAEADGYLIVNHDVTKTYALSARQQITPVDAATVTAEINSTVAGAIEDNNTEVLGFKRINYFNPATITTGKYLSPTTGNLLTNADYFTSDYIDVSGLSRVLVAGSRFVCCYDATKTHLGEDCTPEADTRGTISVQTLETGTKYIRVSSENSYLNTLQVGSAITLDKYAPYDSFTLDGLIVPDSDAPVIVDASGGGDYTSFTLACKENYNNSRDIIVRPGTYNIVSEYVAIWGQSAVDNMADADGSTFDGWQYGVKMNKRKFTFLPGAKLVCDWTGHTVDGTHRFSALRVEMNVEIEGLDLDCTATFYCIHDDYGNNTTPYTVKYKNCRVIGHSITNSNCIGGGCKKFSRHIIENCYFDNGGLSSSTTVRYHNTNADGAVPELFISHSYFNGWLTPRYYGTQTTKMRAYINNCKAQKITVIAESGSYTTENVDLFKWCNEEAE